SDFRVMLGKILTIEGHQVSFAGNGWEALLVLDGNGIDLCVIDVMMPGMDGPTLLKIMRNAAKHRALPVIIVSVLDPGETTHRLGPLHVEGIVRKDQKLIEDLMDKVNMVL